MSNKSTKATKVNKSNKALSYSAYRVTYEKYDDIYGIDLNAYLKRHDTTLSSIIRKTKIDIEILRENLASTIQIEQQLLNEFNSMLKSPSKDSYTDNADNIRTALQEYQYLINQIYETIRKKERHLNKLLEWE